MSTMQIGLFDIDIATRVPTDICSNRHRGNSESIAANPSKESKRQSHEDIMSILKVRKMSHSKEIASLLGKPLNAISGRITELVVLNKVRRLKERVDGCALLEIAE